MLESGSLFNESFYLSANPDVAEAKAKGIFNSGFDHFAQFGKFEHRNPSAFFAQSLYLSQNSDVARAVDAGIIGNAFDHFIQFGQKERREASIVFENSYYLSHHSDVADAVNRDELTGIEHFVNSGIDEGRASSIAFDVRYYLEQNADLKAAGFNFRQALQHFVTHGLQEGRASSQTFDVRYYLDHNPDLKAASFNYQQAFQHYLVFGWQEGRLGSLPLSNGHGQISLDPVTGNPGVTFPENSNSGVINFPTSPQPGQQDDGITDPFVPIVSPDELEDDTVILSGNSAGMGEQLTPTVTPPKTLSGLEQEPTPPLDLPPNAGGGNSHHNPAPKHLQFSTTQEEYYQNTSVRIKDAWVFDASGASDLDKVEFSLHKIGNQWETLDNATQFITYSKDERWGWFNYQVNDLAPGKYQLKGVAYDKDGGKSNTAVAHFTVSDKVLPMPLIGVIDTGFSANNPDVDYSRITLGKDWVDGDDNPLLQAGEGNEHGTHILGIIAATQNNGVGIYGMNDQAPLWLGRAIGSGKWAESLIEFVDAAKASGQPKALVNLSLDMTQVNPDGSVTTRYEFTPKEREALEYARQNGVLIVAAAGNDGDVMSVLGQASQEFDNIITVGAANGNQRADYSSFGYGLDIVTEGGTIENPIVSTVGDDVGTIAGTSVAAAQVTGAASLVWEANPGLNYRQVIEVLKSNATDLNTVGWDKETGAGFLNVDKAVEAAKAIVPVAYAPDAFLTPTTWGGEGKVTAEERAVDFSGQILNVGDVQYTTWLRVRSGPGTSYSEVTKIDAGTTLIFDDQTQGEWVNDQSGYGGSDTWYHLADGSGWMSALYIGNKVDLTPPPTDTGTPVDNTNQDNSGSGNIDSSGSGNTDSSGSGNIDNGGSGNIDYVPPPPPPPPSITINGYTIDGNFYPVFQNYQGTLGNPTSGIINYSSGVSYQQFENGSIVSSANGTFPLYGAIRQRYLNTGGLSGWLGAPKSGEIGLGNGNIIQYFEKGHIYWNGSKATAFADKDKGVPSGVVPSPKPIANNRTGGVASGGGNPGTGQTSNVSTTLRFELDNASLWDTQGSGFGLDFDAQWTVKPEKTWDLLGGMQLALEASFDANIYGFLSAGTVDIGLSGDFQVNKTTDAITGQTTLSVNTANLNPYYPYMSTYLGLGAGLGVSAGVKASLKNIPFYGDISAEISNQFNLTAEQLIANLLAPGASKFGEVDLGFKLNTNLWKNGNEMEADDTAGVKLDINKLGEIPDFLKLSVDLGVKQTSKAKLAGFWFDPDNIDGNPGDFYVPLGESGGTKDPLGFIPQALRVRPDISIETNFAALAKGSVSVGVGDAIKGILGNKMPDGILGNVLGNVPLDIGLSREVGIPISSVSTKPFTNSGYWKSISLG